MARCHRHFCANHAKGCTDSYPCTAAPERDEDGQKFCPLNPCDDVLCEECRESQCEDCGRYLSVEPHDADCELVR